MLALFRGLVWLVHRMQLQPQSAEQATEEGQKAEETQESTQDGQEEVVAVMEETVNVPLTANGIVIGRAIVSPNGQVSAFIGPERAELWRRYFRDNSAVSIIMTPELIPARRPEPDTRPVYKKGNVFVNDTADIFMSKARSYVRQYIEARLDKSDPPVDFEVYLVWFSKTLQNWKALVSSTLPDDMYYEVTYNGDKQETYIDAYKKVDNVCVADTLEQTGFQILEF